MDNHENHYHFEIQEPAGISAEQTSQNTGYSGIKKMIIRAVAIGCAASLLIGGGIGVLIGGSINKNTAQQSTADPNDSQENSNVFDNLIPDSGKNDEMPSNADNLLYADNGSTKELSVEDVVAKAENSVVAIVINYKAEQTFGYQTFYYDAEASGSGVIVSEDGYIVTNNHVIAGAETITVTLADQTTHDAKLVAADDMTDLALIKIDAAGLPAAEIGSSANLVKGETAVIIGNPLGYLDGSVSAGVVSGLDRTLRFSDGTTLYHMIQTDASVNPGNSGGGLFNDRGQLIGIVTAKTSSTEVEGLGFAIPSDDFMEVINDLHAYGYVKGRPALGINTVTISSSMEAMYYGLPRTGVYVQGFLSSEVQASSELQIGDCIVSINGMAISNSSEILNILTEYNVGDTVEIEVYRSGELLTVKSTLIEQNADY